MFMSADKSGHLRSQNELVSFILNKEKTGMPDKYKVFLYATISSYKRFLGYSVSIDAITLKIQKWSEINSQPFG